VDAADAQRDTGPTEVRWVALPPGAESPVVAYVNGEPRREGAGITVAGGRVWFDPPLRARPQLGFWRKAMLAAGIGVYGDLRGDTLDLTFTRAGRTESLAEVTLVPTAPPPRSG
jgi:hypothetical protein